MLTGKKMKKESNWNDKKRNIIISMFILERKIKKKKRKMKIVEGIKKQKCGE